MSIWLRATSVIERLPVMAFVAVISALGTCVPSFAADTPTKATAYKAPPALLANSWTGFYVGANAGYAWSAGDVTYTVDPFFAGAAVNTPPGDAGRAALAGASTHVSDNGFTGGVQAGYNWQRNNIVVGIEADFNALKLDASADTVGRSGTIIPWVDTIHTSIKTDWLLTVRPRIGVASNQVLLYVTGGLAVTRLKTFEPVQQ